jgi:hypothetical protein
MATLTDHDLLAHYDELDRLIERACAAIQAGDRAGAILLSSAVVQKTGALDRRLRALGLLPEGP